MKFNWEIFADYVIIIGCLMLFTYFLVDVRPNITSEMHCADAQHCTLTIMNRGGGFKHGLNPSDTWQAVNIPAGMHLSSTSGIIASGQSTHVSVVIDPGVNHASINYTDTWGAYSLCAGIREF